MTRNLCAPCALSVSPWRQRGLAPAAASDLGDHGHGPWRAWAVVRGPWSVGAASAAVRTRAHCWSGHNMYYVYLE